MIINCILEKKLPIYGKGLNIRDWLYVEDHCEAIDVIIKKATIGETYNIGGNSEMKNIDIVKLICEKMNLFYPRSNGKKYEELIIFVEDRPGHDYRYAIDATKIKTDLGWKPKYDFEKGICKTIEWYLNNKNWWMDIYNKKYNHERLGII